MPGVATQIAKPSPARPGLELERHRRAVAHLRLGTDFFEHCFEGDLNRRAISIVFMISTVSMQTLEIACRLSCSSFLLRSFLGRIGKHLCLLLGPGSDAIELMFPISFEHFYPVVNGPELFGV